MVTFIGFLWKRKKHIVETLSQLLKPKKVEHICNIKASLVSQKKVVTTVYNEIHMKLFIVMKGAMEYNFEMEKMGFWFEKKV